MLYDALKFLVYKFHTAHSRLLQTPNLTLHQQFKWDFWHKQCRPWTLHMPQIQPSKTAGHNGHSQVRLWVLASRTSNVFIMSILKHCVMKANVTCISILTVVRLSENVHGFHSYYHPLTVTASRVGAPLCQPCLNQYSSPSSSSLSPLSSFITPSLFHSKLKTYLFQKSFPP